MNRILRGVLPALAAVGITATIGAAQAVPSSYQYIQKNRSLTAYAGYLFTNPGVALPDSQNADLGPQSAPLFGLRYSLRVGGPLSLEGNVAFSPSQRKLYNAVLDPDTTHIVVTETGDEVSEPLVLAEAAVRFHLTGDRTYRGLAPFVLASGGAVMGLGGTSDAEKDIPEHRRFDFGPGLAVSVGTGVDFFPSQRMSLRTEVDYRLWRMAAPAGLLRAGAGKVSEWGENIGVTVGAAYHF